MTEDKLTAYIREFDVLMTQCPVFPKHIKDNMSSKMTDIDLPYIFNGYLERRSVHNSFNGIRLTSNVVVDDEIIGMNI